MPSKKFDLVASARAEMVREGFEPDYPEAVVAEVQHLPQTVSEMPKDGLHDLRDLAWSSIDNSTSLDLDQIEVVERAGDAIRVRVGIADVDAVVAAGSAIDQYAAREATSVYVPGHVFSMIPEVLSAGLTSLLAGQDRAALVVTFMVGPAGEIAESSLVQALVCNRYQLAYGRVGAWLERRGPVPEALASSQEMQQQLWLQDEVAQRLRKRRAQEGSLQFDRNEVATIFEDGQIRRIEVRQKNRATELIEELMIAANEVIAETLTRAGIASIRRVVKKPERWARIVTLAAQHGTSLPAEPDSGALAVFLQRQKETNADEYPELSLAILKLLGPGEYLVLRAGAETLGHFGLAAADYTHSTAPNRRFADLVTQRLLKAMMGRQAAPYTDEELDAIAKNCTLREDAARKVERALQKQATAYALRSRVGQTFRALITGVTPRGVFARVANPPIEGRVMEGEKGLDVGDRVRLKLIRADPATGFLDFAR